MEQQVPASQGMVVAFDLGKNSASMIEGEA